MAHKPSAPWEEGPFADLSIVLRQWDKGSKKMRVKLLDTFVKRCKGSTGSQLEHDFANGTSLFLARITSWFRLSFNVGGAALMAQLQAITVFVEASSGHRFLSEFLEVGGINTCLDILIEENLSQEDKTETLRLLHKICQGGRVYKEYVCESGGLAKCAACMNESKNVDLLTASKELLLALGHGNPKHLSSVARATLQVTVSENFVAQPFAAFCLRCLTESDTKFRPTALMVRICFTLLNSPDLQVQYEACELIPLMAREEALHVQIIEGLIYILRQEHSDDDNVVSSFSTKVKEYPLHAQQAAAAKLLRAFARHSSDNCLHMDDVGVIRCLLANLVNTQSTMCQKEAGNTLNCLGARVPAIDVALRGLLGNLYPNLRDNPHNLYKEFSAHHYQAIEVALRTLAYKEKDLHVPWWIKDRDGDLTLPLNRPANLAKGPNAVSMRDVANFGGDVNGKILPAAEDLGTIGETEEDTKTERTVNTQGTKRVTLITDKSDDEA